MEHALLQLPPDCKYPVEQVWQAVVVLQRRQVGIVAAQEGLQTLFVKVNKFWQLVQVDMSEHPWQY